MAVILGLGGGYYHDASACLVIDGELVAFAEEERFSRRKHNADSQSCGRAALSCLSEAGLMLEDIDEITVGWNNEWPHPSDQSDDPNLIGALLPKELFGGYQPKSLTVLPHHLAHAASAFYCSGFTKSAVVVTDGSGDGVSTSIWLGSPGGLRLVRTWPFTQSLGWVYEAVAEHVGLGAWTNTGKLMGLAGYGEPRFNLPFLVATDDGYRLDLTKYGIDPAVGHERDYLNLDYYRALRRACRIALADTGVPPRAPEVRWDPSVGAARITTDFQQAHRDLAASAQAVLEACLLSVARQALDAGPTENLCLAGGVALSCSANGVLRRHSGARDLFVQPAAGDAGLAIGGALEAARRQGDLARTPTRIKSVAWGPAFSDDDIGAALRHAQVEYHHLGNALPQRVAELIANQHVVGWFQGRMEAGPRALGQRSILGDPRSEQVRDRINRDIKRREQWRPLAPSMLTSTALQLVEDPDPNANFMIIAHAATDEAKRLTPGVVHVDGSLRPQLVPDDETTPYAELLHHMKGLTGFGAVINTSFNHQAEPIVCTPADALRTFFASPMDVLAIGGHLVTKSDLGAP